MNKDSRNYLDFRSNIRLWSLTETLKIFPTKRIEKFKKVFGKSFSDYLSEKDLPSTFLKLPIKGVFSQQTEGKKSYKCQSFDRRRSFETFEKCKLDKLLDICFGRNLFVLNFSNHFKCDRCVHK